MTIITKDIAAELSNFLLSKKYDNIFILTDENTLHHCFPAIGDLPELKNTAIITIKAGDIHK
ncbi:MAG: 3-dehydroquinate synthase, partial [Tannerella sp.]|nr:3-dehydroquinate synthase [Tannerella sp.]